MNGLAPGFWDTADRSLQWIGRGAARLLERRHSAGDKGAQHGAIAVKFQISIDIHRDDFQLLLVGLGTRSRFHLYLDVSADRPVTFLQLLANLLVAEVDSESIIPQRWRSRMEVPPRPN